MGEIRSLSSEISSRCRSRCDVTEVDAVDMDDELMEGVSRDVDVNDAAELIVMAASFPFPPPPTTPPTRATAPKVPILE